MLQTPRTSTKKTLGDRVFLAAAPKLWNGLPSQIRNEPFFIDLKVYLRPIFLRLAFFYDFLGLCIYYIFIDPCF